MDLPKSRYDIGDPDRLSKYFSWQEVTKSDTADELGIKNHLTEVQASNAIILHDTILYPLRVYLGEGVIVNSWARGEELNLRVGGDPKSYHLLGLGADIRTRSHSTFELVDIIQLLALRFDKVINEFQRWAHVQAPKPPRRPRLQVITAHIHAGQKIYLPGNQKVDPITNRLKRE